MEELVIISGKGGTGKTSVAAALAVLADNAVIADCDVDAADLHLVLEPEIKEKHDFYSGHEAIIRVDDCTACGICEEYCRFDAVKPTTNKAGDPAYKIDPVSCEGCGVCVRFCPVKAIDIPDRLCGVWMISDTRCGPMVHARLGVAQENSGKLVSTVRKEARRLLEETGRDRIIVDGPPGIGCPVIASITGATHILIVTEPTVSGEHDMDRALKLAKHFKIPASVCVNKWDLNPEMTERIEKHALENHATLSGRIRYDIMMTRAQIEGVSVIETDAPCAEDIRNIWKKLAGEKQH